MEFHVSRIARDRYGFEHSLFSTNGNVIFANFHSSRLFAQKMNQKHDLINFPEQVIKSGQINAMGLIDEILHHVIHLYRLQINPRLMVNALDYLEEKIGRDELERTLQTFTHEFPPIDVYQDKLSAEDYLDGTTGGIPNRAVALEELLMLWISNKNPAFDPYQELFDEDFLKSETAYPMVIRDLYLYFNDLPFFGPDQQNLIDMLRSPTIKVPYSPTGQLEYIREHWSDLLGIYLSRLLSSLDLIKEEEKIHFQDAGPVEIPLFDFTESDAERFTLDKDWMPRLVLIAKNTYVWLDQLSKKYQRPITHLDQIPDEELDRLAQWGFTGLWLIGLWERSRASARIKQLMGNPEAIASAYSLAGYQIASDLGGEESLNNLIQRAWQRGIRLGSDMVPNHMGIDSRWVIEHPDWFVSLDHSPFPSYTFNGPDLSPDPAVSIYLEDHYYNRSDASVVFKLVDHRNSQTRYIYHGNDGTSMPWNDTAQLNYLDPHVREEVIQAILNVARKFPIIRFDAAMTLSKRHYQRLWFPEPGSGGDIPSRSEHGLAKEQFHRSMPTEFWRNVVDRVAQEASDTLLLAEAFWLMESYFVRTLGMHRVYNSAFMHLLRNEDNTKFRQIIKNTLEFDPEILKRFVNFMNNPDERTAVDQFGKGDKYFGICTLLTTFPGLPMFGHGQIEGYTEKYGMEFKRAYWDENPDPYLFERHQRQIFPLLHRRHVFANVDNFQFYDFYSTDGFVHEDVIAYSNQYGEERALVIYMNKYAEANGWVHRSVNFSRKIPGSDQKYTDQKPLGEGLNIPKGENDYVIFKDQVSGLEFLRSCEEINQKGLFFHLSAYQTHVFINFRFIQDDSGQSYRHLCQYLNGRGVQNVEEVRKELLLQPVQHPFLQISNTGYVKYLLSHIQLGNNVPEQVFEEAGYKIEGLLKGIGQMTGLSVNLKGGIFETKSLLKLIYALVDLEHHTLIAGARRYKKAAEIIKSGLKINQNNWLVLFGWLFTHHLGKLSGIDDPENQTLSWMDEWQFNRILAETFQSCAISESQAWRMTTTIRILISQNNWFDNNEQMDIKFLLNKWFTNSDIQWFIGFNRFNDIFWFKKEGLEELLFWMVTLATIKLMNKTENTLTDFLEGLITLEGIRKRILKAAKISDYQAIKLLKAMED